MISSKSVNNGYQDIQKFELDHIVAENNILISNSHFETHIFYWRLYLIFRYMKESIDIDQYIRTIIYIYNFQYINKLNNIVSNIFKYVSFKKFSVILNLLKMSV